MYEIIKVNSFGAKSKTLRIADQILSFDNQNVSLDQVTGLKYGVSLMLFYRFSLGRSYQISLQTPTSQVDIVLRSYFQISNHYLQHLYQQILELIWEPVADRLLRESTQLLLSGQILRVGNCALSQAGIVLNKAAGLTKKPQLITWDELSYEAKYDRLVLNSKNNPALWTNVYFLDTWNGDILLAILDWLYQENGLAELKQ